MDLNKIWEICYEEAQLSTKNGDVPIGAVIVKNNEILASAHNTRQLKHDIIGHAEVNAIRSAAKKLGRWNLSDCILYVNLKPCSMCLEIIKQARVSKVIYLLDKLSIKNEYNKTEIIKDNESNVCEQTYLELLQEFFKEKR